MSTATTTPMMTSHLVHAPDIRIYSHTRVLYWWPVWAIAFAMALWTWLDHRALAIVPENSSIAGNILTAPEDVQLEQRLVHVSRSPLPGAIFIATLLFIAIFSNASLRGPWALFFGAVVACFLLFFSWMHWWGPIARSLGLLRIYINLAGYLAVAIPLFAAWLLTFFFLDRRTYIVFGASQLRVCDELGEAEKVFDASGVAFEKQPYDWFRRLVGCGAGDLVVRTGGTSAQTYELSNVVRVGRWLNRVEARLKTRDVE
jgi:hypothetical protein